MSLFLYYVVLLSAELVSGRPISDVIISYKLNQLLRKFKKGLKWLKFSYSVIYDIILYGFLSKDLLNGCRYILYRRVELRTLNDKSV